MPNALQNSNLYVLNTKNFLGYFPLNDVQVIYGKCYFYCPDGTLFEIREYNMGVRVY
jgi:hypothetical protein